MVLLDTVALASPQTCLSAASELSCLALSLLACWKESEKVLPLLKILASSHTHESHTYHTQTTCSLLVCCLYSYTLAVMSASAILAAMPLHIADNLANNVNARACQTHSHSECICLLQGSFRERCCMCEPLTGPMMRRTLHRTSLRSSATGKLSNTHTNTLVCMYTAE